MKNRLLFFLSFTPIFFSSCSDSTPDDDQYAEYVVARPLILSKADFANGVDIVPPQPIDESGKVYTYGDYIFINDKSRGIHVVENSNPQQPVKIAFIEISGNVHISIKDNFLYFDSFMYLIVLDISDITDLQQVNRLENVLREGVIFPFEADIVEYGSYNYETDVFV